MIIKAYAVATHQPYTITRDFDYLDVYKLYLTDSGFEWLLSVFTQHDLVFLRRTFGFVFINADEKDVGDPKYLGYNNFKGITGARPKAGTKQRAVLVQHIGRRNKEFQFDTIRDARKEILNLSRFYPIDDFTLYRIRKNTRKGKVTHYREKIPVLLPRNNRGIALRK